MPVLRLTRLPTPDSQLTTHNSQLTTHNSQLQVVVHDAEGTSSAATIRTMLADDGPGGGLADGPGAAGGAEAAEAPDAADDQAEHQRLGLPAEQQSL